MRLGLGLGLVHLLLMLVFWGSQVRFLSVLVLVKATNNSSWFSSYSVHTPLVSVTCIKVLIGIDVYCSTADALYRKQVQQLRQ